MSNKWICLDCDTVNDSSRSRCTKCGATKFFKGLMATRIENGNDVIYSKQPTIWILDEVAFGKDSNRKLGKCPECSKLMFVSDGACPHCCHILSEQELDCISAVNHFKFSYYVKSFVIWSLIIAGLTYLVSQ